MVSSLFFFGSTLHVPVPSVTTCLSALVLLLFCIVPYFSVRQLQPSNVPALFLSSFLLFRFIFPSRVMSSIFGALFSLLFTVIFLCDLLVSFCWWNIFLFGCRKSDDGRREKEASWMRKRNQVSILQSNGRSLLYVWSRKEDHPQSLRFISPDLTVTLSRHF